MRRTRKQDAHPPLQRVTARWLVSVAVVLAIGATKCRSNPSTSRKPLAFVGAHDANRSTMPIATARCPALVLVRGKTGMRRSSIFGRSAVRCEKVHARRAIHRTRSKSSGADGYGGPRPDKRPLGALCTAMNDAILEMCVENRGRPLARSMTDFVEYCIEALAAGYSVDQLLLELLLLDSTTRVPGQTLTGVEKRYRTQWIAAMHAVMQNLNFMEQQEPKTAEEFHIKSQVDVVLRGRQTNDEQTFVKFDKALATGGVAGGVATERIVISPQMVPLSQLILLAIRALQKLEDASAA